MTAVEHDDAQQRSDSTAGADTLEVRVVRRELVADDVVGLTLSAGGAWLPEWEPGAHIDVVVADGTTRQFSLCSDPARRDVYEIAVLRDPNGRGGSRYLHEAVLTGSAVQIKKPRNHFRFDEAGRYLFVAGGIGITPMLPMIAAAQRRGVPWRLVYLGRSRSTMAFADRLADLGDAVTLWPKDDLGTASIQELLGVPGPDTLVYACGPQRLLAALESAAAQWDGAGLRLERFEAGELTAPVRADDFEVYLSASDMTVTVGPETSILQALAEHGVDVDSSCGDGTCGTCEVSVLDGEPDHRDVVLTDEERACNDCMMVCVSRAASARLVLDL
ncbi:PDR/VanB family oxidoreductase [Gordonia polyisoprenivorans]|uniref:PDR/VanB family oxidoreductase n=1 Tax=Gordonia polyisoprenivorans TaxID=84595 RepID=UPI001AD7D34A|nr:PDR/VanB family oxidoreductase [Gordonia polyisoprenivorans]QTI68995.1 oxidoreductase [Gordonia polyisoprenivorans]